MDASPFGCWRSRGKMPSCCHATQPGHVPEDAGAPDCLSYLSPRVAREMVHECRVWASPLVKPETAVVSDQLKKQDPKLQTLGTETVFELHGSPPPRLYFFYPFPHPPPPPPRPHPAPREDEMQIPSLSITVPYLLLSTPNLSLLLFLYLLPTWMSPVGQDEQFWCRHHEVNFFRVVAGVGGGCGWERTVQPAVWCVQALWPALN